MSFQQISRLSIIVCFSLFLFISCTDEADSRMQVILCIGQSNMAGRAEIPDSDTFSLEKVFLFNDQNQWEHAKNPLNRYSTVRKGIRFQRLGPAWSFAESLSSYYPDKIFGLVVNARGGSSIDEWAKDSLCYNELVSRALEAKKTGEIIGIIWHQGESDRNKLDGYLEKFSTMVMNLRSDIGISDLPIVVGEIGESRANTKLVNEQIRQIPEKVPFSGYVSRDGLTFMKDTVHFDTPAQLELGKRYSKEFIELLDR